MRIDRSKEFERAQVVLTQLFKNHTPKDLARQTGISYHSVLSWKNKDRAPNSEALRKLEVYLERTTGHTPEQKVP